MDTKDKAERKLISGVFVIGSKRKNKVNALTAVWVSRVSFNPSLVMASIGEGRYTLDMIKESKVFSVNILGKSQVDAVKHFGFQSGRNANKFEKIDYETSKTGSPLLKDCIAWMDCEVVGEYKTGDHVIFIGKVVDEKVLSDEEPLKYNYNDHKS